MKRLRHQCYVLAHQVSGAFITTFPTDNQETTRLASLKDKILSNHTLPLIFLSKRYLGVIPYFATLFRRTSHQLSAASFLYSR